MIIGIPKEIKNNEHRVGILPFGVETLTKAGHTVVIETQAGIGSGVEDADYLSVGAKIVGRAEDVYARAEMIVKIKEPLERECELLREGQILFTFLHS